MRSFYLQKIYVIVKADLEGCSFRAPEDMEYYVKIECANCGTPFDKHVYVSSKEEIQIGKGTTNFLAKCKACGREITIDILENSQKPYLLEDSGKSVAIVGFDCRGASVLEFQPRDGFIVESEDGKLVWEEVDLSEDWQEYDEKTKATVTISNFTSTLDSKPPSNKRR